MFPIHEPDRHYGCRVNDQFTLCGYRTLVLQNELLQIIVLIDKGSEIVQFLYKPLDIDFLWRAPNGLRDPRFFIPTGGSPTTPFMDHWGGGWFEVLPNGGPACNFQGAELGYYAETINIPWEYQVLEDTPEQVSVALWVKTYRTPFLLQKTLTLKAHSVVLHIQEKLTNQGKESLDFMWGHHPVVGAPFLDESRRLFAPDCKVEVLHDEDGPDYRMGLFQQGRWPVIQDRNGKPFDLRVIPPASGRTMDNCYLKEFEEGWIAVNKPGHAGFGLAWDPKVFRYVWVWQALGGGLGYPWYGRTYNMGIEPWTSYPCTGLVKAAERGTAMHLEAGERLEAWLCAVAFTGKDTVNRIDRDGTVVGLSDSLID